MAKVLIIEDDPLILRMYQTVFQFENFDVETARDGAEGYGKLEALNPLPKVVLLDIMMPKMSGIDVLKKIKANPKLSKIPIIVLTNLSGMTDAEMALDLGAVKFIIKSQHKPKEVVSEVKEILKASTRDEIPQPAQTHPGKNIS